MWALVVKKIIMVLLLRKGYNLHWLASHFLKFYYAWLALLIHHGQNKYGIFASMQDNTEAQLKSSVNNKDAIQVGLHIICLSLA